MPRAKVVVKHRATIFDAGRFIITNIGRGLSAMGNSITNTSPAALPLAGTALGAFCIYKAVDLAATTPEDDKKYPGYKASLAFWSTAGVITGLFATVSGLKSISQISGTGILSRGASMGATVLLGIIYYPIRVVFELPNDKKTIIINGTKVLDKMSPAEIAARGKGIFWSWGSSILNGPKIWILPTELVRLCTSFCAFYAEKTAKQEMEKFNAVQFFEPNKIQELNTFGAELPGQSIFIKLMDLNLGIKLENGKYVKDTSTSVSNILGSLVTNNYTRLFFGSAPFSAVRDASRVIGFSGVLDKMSVGSIFKFTRINKIIGFHGVLDKISIGTVAKFTGDMLCSTAMSYISIGLNIGSTGLSVASTLYFKTQVTQANMDKEDFATAKILQTVPNAQALDNDAKDIFRAFGRVEANQRNEQWQEALVYKLLKVGTQDAKDELSDIEKACVAKLTGKAEAEIVVIVGKVTAPNYDAETNVKIYNANQQIAKIQSDRNAAPAV